MAQDIDRVMQILLRGLDRTRGNVGGSLRQALEDAAAEPGFDLSQTALSQGAVRSSAGERLGSEVGLPPRAATVAELTGIPQAESWPTGYGHIESPYGPRRYNGQTFHYGMDIRNRLNQPAHSMFNGTVSYIDRNPNGREGTFIGVHDDNGNLVTYLHTGPENDLQVGQRVSAGDVVGYSNGTPSVTPHLHVGLRRGTPESPATMQDTFVDPAMMLYRLRGYK